METVYVIVAILLAIVISDLLNKLCPRIPIIFIQIVIGVCIASLPFSREFRLEPEIFMIVLIKPLIFNEGQKLSVSSFKENFRPIISLALVLVVVSIVLIAAILQLVFPELSAATTFLIAAVIIPTNASIVKGLSNRYEFPEQAEEIIDGESLFSDAIAMIMFELAVSAGITHEFHIRESLSEFAIAIIGGVIIGLVLGYIIVKIRYWIIKNDFESASMMVVIQVITPFIVFIIAEGVLHVSGIIAVVVAGILHAIEKPLLNLKSTKLQVISSSAWGVIDYVLDGMVAILLGLALPGIVETVVKDTDSMAVWWMVLVAVAIYVAFGIIRFLWVYFQPQKFRLEEEESVGRGKGAFLYAISGIHGTISIAIALLIPKNIGGGQFAHLRDGLIFITAVSVIVSIIVPAFIYPLVLESREKNAGTEDVRLIQQQMICHTIQKMEQLFNEHKERAILQVIHILQQQLSFLQEQGLVKPNRRVITDLLNEVRKKEFVFAEQVIEEKKLPKQLGTFYRAYVQKNSMGGIKSLFWNLRTASVRRKLEKKKGKAKHREGEFLNQFLMLQDEVTQRVISYLKTIQDTKNYAEIKLIMQNYSRRLTDKEDELQKENVGTVMRKYVVKALQYETIYVEDQLEEGVISHSTAALLREQISCDQLVYLKR